MKKKTVIQFVVMCALIVGLFTGCGPVQTAPESQEEAKIETTQEQSAEKEQEGSEYPLTISNKIADEDHSVTFDKAPERAVSLSGFTTEMMLALGLEDKMVGYGYQDNPVPQEYEAAIAKVKELSKTNPTQEILLDAQPDFLTGWKSTFSEKNFSPEFCKQYGINIYLPRTEYPNATMETVYEDFMILGKIFNVQAKAEEIVAQMKKDIAIIHEKVKDNDPVHVFIYDSGEDAPFTASAGLPTEMIRLAGGENIFAGNEKNWLGVSWDQVIERNPEAIIIMDYAGSDPVEVKREFLKSNPALQTITAIKEDRMMVLGLSDVLAGTRDVKAIESMAKFFHPEAFQ